MRPRTPAVCWQQGALERHLPAWMHSGGRTLTVLPPARVCGCTAVPPAQVTNGLSDALLRASAERAVQAVLMAPLTLQDESAADRLSEKVMTGGWKWAAGARGEGRGAESCTR